jgi:hypothetical protein
MGEVEMQEDPLWSLEEQHRVILAELGGKHGVTVLSVLHTNSLRGILSVSAKEMSIYGLAIVILILISQVLYIWTANWLRIVHAPLYCPSTWSTKVPR